MMYNVQEIYIYISEKPCVQLTSVDSLMHVHPNYVIFKMQLFTIHTWAALPPNFKIYWLN